jgi:hypothetical protein
MVAGGRFGQAKTPNTTFPSCSRANAMWHIGLLLQTYNNVISQARASVTQHNNHASEIYSINIQKQYKNLIRI